MPRLTGRVSRLCTAEVLKLNSTVAALVSRNANQAMEAPMIGSSEAVDFLLLLTGI
jgi:hypothetical protein